MSRALKEWSVVVDALGSGELLILLRKGGLSEGPGGLAIPRAERFWLFPTQFHAQQTGLRSEFAQRFRAPAEPGRSAAVPDQVELRYSATLVTAQFVQDPDLLQRLRPHHIWSDALVAERFAWRRPPGVHVWVLRVFRTPVPSLLALTPAHRGCTSWIEIETPLDDRPWEPVLNEPTFTQRVAALPLPIPDGRDRDPAPGQPLAGPLLAPDHPTCRPASESG